MMLRTLHIAILRNAALLVPTQERADWIAEWRAELWYVEHDATAFCVGSFRDALWLRRNSHRQPSRAFSLDSPLRCVLLLVGLATLTVSLAIPSRELWLPSWSLRGAEQVALELLQMYLLPLLILLTLNPLTLGEYPINRHAPSMIIRLRRWIFLALKIALVPIPLSVCVVLLPVFPLAPWTLFFGLIFGFRWVLTDQKQRCPICLHLLSNPVQIGSPARSVLDWYGTELVCVRGHGFLFVPGAPTSWCSKQKWQYLDPTWSTLLP